MTTQPEFTDVTLRIRILMPPNRPQKNITGKPWLFVEHILPDDKRHLTAYNFEVLDEIKTP